MKNNHKSRTAGNKPHPVPPFSAIFIFLSRKYDRRKKKKRSVNKTSKIRPKNVHRKMEYFPQNSDFTTKILFKFQCKKFLSIYLLNILQSDSINGKIWNSATIQKKSTRFCYYNKFSNRKILYSLWIVKGPLCRRVK